MKKIKILYKFYDWNVIFYDFAFAYDAFLTKKNIYLICFVTNLPTKYTN